MWFLLEGRGVSFQMLLWCKDYNSILMATCHSLTLDLSKVSFIVWRAFKDIFVKLAWCFLL
jgi:hypothetical protein